MTTSLTVAVHGATGTQGAPMARRLLEDGHRVRAVVRHPDADRSLPAGAEPYAADLLDGDALARAYDGVDAVVLHLPLEFAADRAVPQAERALEALERAGVRRVVFNAGGPVPPEPVGVPYLDARVHVARALAAGPFAGTVVGPGLGYMENLSAPWSAERIAAEGVLAYPLPADVPVPWVALDDLAAVVSAALHDTGGAPGPLVVVGPQALTGERAAEALAAAIGRAVRWRTIAPQEYGAMLAPHIGDDAAAGIAGFYAAAADGPPPPPPAPESVRPGSTALREWAARQPWPLARAA